MQRNEAADIDGVFDVSIRRKLVFQPMNENKAAKSPSRSREFLLVCIKYSQEISSSLFCVTFVWSYGLAFAIGEKEKAKERNTTGTRISKFADWNQFAAGQFCCDL